jgi:hypothetical protein
MILQRTHHKFLDSKSIDLKFLISLQKQVQNFYSFIANLKLPMMKFYCSYFHLNSQQLSNCLSTFSYQCSNQILRNFKIVHPKFGRLSINSSLVLMSYLSLGVLILLEGHMYEVISVLD